MWVKQPNSAQCNRHFLTGTSELVLGPKTHFLPGTSCFRFLFGNTFPARTWFVRCVSLTPSYSSLRAAGSFLEVTYVIGVLITVSIGAIW